jgi:hypothetical protein
MFEVGSSRRGFWGGAQLQDVKIAAVAGSATRRRRQGSSTHTHPSHSPITHHHPPPPLIGALRRRQRPHRDPRGPQLWPLPPGAGRPQRRQVCRGGVAAAAQGHGVDAGAAAARRDGWVGGGGGLGRRVGRFSSNNTYLVSSTYHPPHSPSLPHPPLTPTTPPQATTTSRSASSPTPALSTSRCWRRTARWRPRRRWGAPTSSWTWCRRVGGVWGGGWGVAERLMGAGKTHARDFFWLFLFAGYVNITPSQHKLPVSPLTIHSTDQSNRHHPPNAELQPPTHPPPQPPFPPNQA